MTPTRRGFLATAGSVAALSVAGCLGSDGGNPDDGAGNGGDEFELPGEDVLPVPVAGDPDAGVTVMAFEDFACPHCRQYKAEVYPELKQSYIEPGEIRYEHHDFPIPVDSEWSWGIAGAARSVQDQAGDEAFWAFAERIYDHQGQYSNGVVAEVAGTVDEVVDGEVEPDAVVTDVEDGTYRGDLESERERGIEAGVESTPTIVVDGRTVDPLFDEIQSAIEDAS